MNESKRADVTESTKIRDEDLQNSYLKQGDEPAFRLMLLAAMKNDAIQKEVFYSWCKGGMQWFVSVIAVVLIAAFLVYAWPLPYIASILNS